MLYTIVNKMKGGLSLKNKVKEKRLERGLSQEELSVLSKVSRTLISKLETEQLNNISVLTMDKISKALKTSKSELFF